MISLLEKEGLLGKVEEILHRTPLCERSKTPIEIIPMDEYYLKVVDVKEQLEDIAKNELHFHPEMHRSILLNWIEVARDWRFRDAGFTGPSTGDAPEELQHSVFASGWILLSTLERSAAGKPSLREMRRARIHRRSKNL